MILATGGNDIFGSALSETQSGFKPAIRRLQVRILMAAMLLIFIHMAYFTRRFMHFLYLPFLKQRKVLRLR